MDAVLQAIKKLEALRDEAYFKSTHHRGAYASNRAGQYHTPTVDAVEVVHGRWVFGELDVLGQPVHCSVCGWGSDMVNRAMWLLYDGHKFCGHCGAKMDGGNEDGVDD